MSNSDPQPEAGTFAPVSLQQGPEGYQEVSNHVRQARDRAQYVRQQKGHSLILHLLFGGLVLWIPAIYYTFSPNHYWHL